MPRKRMGRARNHQRTAPWHRSSNAVRDRCAVDEFGDVLVAARLHNESRNCDMSQTTPQVFIWNTRRYFAHRLFAALLSAPVESDPNMSSGPPRPASDRNRAAVTGANIDPAGISAAPSPRSTSALAVLSSRAVESNVSKYSRSQTGPCADSAVRTNSRIRCGSDPATSAPAE